MSDSEIVTTGTQIDFTRFETAADVLDSFNAIKILSDPMADDTLSCIDSIQVGEDENSECGDTPEGENDYRFLGDVYADQSDKTHQFFAFDRDECEYTTYMDIKSKVGVAKEEEDKVLFQQDKEKRDAGENVPYRYLQNYFDISLYANWDCYYGGYERLSTDAKKTLLQYSDEACYGDVLNEETLVNHTVRKGRDIELAPLIKKRLIKIDNEFLKVLARKFYLFSHIKYVTVKPYKINYYAKGDHFTAHRDSPEEGLVGTIVFHLSGDYDCLTIGPDDDQIVWTKDNGEILMFYPETEHRVNPVPRERWTMTFKVISESRPGTIFSPNLQLLNKRINFSRNFGILLNNGYSYIGVKTVQDLLQTLKGIDLKIYQDLNSLIESGTHTLSVVPVLVDDKEVVDRYGGSGYWDDSDYEEVDGFRSHYQKSTFVSECFPSFRGMRRDISDEITIYNVPEKFLQIVNANMGEHAGAGAGGPVSESNELITPIFCEAETSWKKRPIVFYLGSGHKFFKINKQGVHIGNQSTGWVVDQIYFNFMLQYAPIVPE
jgi:hypothetical protein